MKLYRITEVEKNNFYIKKERKIDRKKKYVEIFFYKHKWKIIVKYNIIKLYTYRKFFSSGKIFSWSYINLKLTLDESWSAHIFYFLLAFTTVRYGVCDVVTYIECINIMFVNNTYYVYRHHLFNSVLNSSKAFLLIFHIVLFFSSFVNIVIII